MIDLFIRVIKMLNKKYLNQLTESDMNWLSVIKTCLAPERIEICGGSVAIL